VDHGFSRTENVSPNRVTYRRASVLVSLAYYVEDLPSPWLAVDVGLVGDDGSHRLAGLWRALPDDEQASGYTRWTFHDSASLDELLRRVVAQVLAVHGPRLWDSKDTLDRLLATQADEVETRYLADRRQADLLQARRAYDEGRFQDAVDNFILIEPDSLSAGDRRRLHEARKRSESSGPAFEV
jgi:hypothetical protein